MNKYSRNSLGALIIVFSTIVICVGLNKGGYLTVLEYDHELVYEDYIKFSERNGDDRKVGLIDKEGNTVIQPKYRHIRIGDDRIYLYRENSKETIIRDEDNNFTRILQETDQGIDYIYDKEGKKHKIEDQWDSYRYSVVDYNHYLIGYKILDSHLNESKRRYGIIDLQGKTVRNQYYESFVLYEGFAVVRTNGLYGVIDTNGVFLIEPKYDYISSHYSEDNQYFVVQKNNKTGIIDLNNEVVIDFKYDYLSHLKDQQYLANIDGKKGVIDINENVIIDFNYTDLYYFSEYKNYLKATKEDGMVGVIDFNENVIVDFKYDKVNGVHRYSHLSDHSDMVFFQINDDGKYGIANEMGEIIIDPNYDRIHYKDKGFFIVTQDLYTGLYDRNGTLIVPKERNGEIGGGYLQPFVDNLIPARAGAGWGKGNRWGFYNFEGELVTEFIYDEVRQIDNQRYLVKRDFKDEIINQHGETVFSTSYDIEKVVDEYIIIKNKDRYRVMNYNNEFVIEPKEGRQIEYVENHKFLIKEDGNIYLMNAETDEMEKILDKHIHLELPAKITLSIHFTSIVLVLAYIIWKKRHSLR